MQPEGDLSQLQEVCPLLLELSLSRVGGAALAKWCNESNERLLQISASGPFLWHAEVSGVEYRPVASQDCNKVTK